MLPTLPVEESASLAMAQLAALAEGQADHVMQEAILAARKAISARLDVLRWNHYARAINRASEARRLRRRHQGRRCHA